VKQKLSDHCGINAAIDKDRTLGREEDLEKVERGVEEEGRVDCIPTRMYRI